MSKRPRRRVAAAWMTGAAIGTALLSSVIAASNTSSQSTASVISVTEPMAPPAWALGQRLLLAANAEGVREFEKQYVDGRGYLRGPAHWGISDGPDDSVEAIRNWPLAHALGGPESIIETWDKVWEGHLEQYTTTRVPEVEMAKDGIYYKEFTPSFDWEHISEGLAPFYSSYDFPPGNTRWTRSNPVATEALVNLTMGGADPGGSGHGPLPLHTQVRHFDPERGRAGLPDGVAALVSQIRSAGTGRRGHADDRAAAVCASADHRVSVGSGLGIEAVVNGGSQLGTTS